jgi:hypothetical protein
MLGAQMFLDWIVGTLADFVDYCRRSLTVDPLLVLPAVILIVSWPMFQVLFDDRAEAFMSSFVLAMAARLVLRFEIIVLRLGKAASPRFVAALVLLAGPGVLAALIWTGEPILCQRFLTVYFLVMAALHALDVVDGAHSMIKASFPKLVLPSATRIMSQVLVLYYMSMVLLNETLIAQFDPAAWLLYFGLLPLLSRAVLTSLHESVRIGTQGAA